MMHLILFIATILAVLAICIVSYNTENDTEGKT